MRADWLGRKNCYEYWVPESSEILANWCKPSHGQIHQRISVALLVLRPKFVKMSADRCLTAVADGEMG